MIGVPSDHLQRGRADPPHLTGTLPENVSLARLKRSQEVTFVPLTSYAANVIFRPNASVNVLPGSTRLTVCPSIQVCFGVGPVTVIPGLGAGATTFAVKVSNTERPLVSVAVTLRLRLCVVAGAVPLNVSVNALNVSQLGSDCPLAWLAV